MRLFNMGLTALLFLCASQAKAACTQEALAGNWTITQTNTNEICGILIDEDGDFEGTCRKHRNGKVSETGLVKGAIKITSACRITGRISGETTARTFTGRSDKGPTMINGIFRQRGGLVGYRN